MLSEACAEMAAVPFCHTLCMTCRATKVENHRIVKRHLIEHTRMARTASIEPYNIVLRECTMKKKCILEPAAAAGNP